MRRFCVLAAICIAISQVSWGAPCGSGTLADYIALGSGGCTIGSNTLYDFNVVSGSFLATAISPSAVTIGELGGTSNPGITATVNVTANGNILEAIFTYRISGNSYSGDSITLAGSSETGNGAVSDAQNYCAGGTFGPDGVTGCTGSAGTLATADGFFNNDSASFGAVNLLSITDDFTLDGSNGGTASGGTITDQFVAKQVAAVPEPFSFLLTGVGFALGAGLTFRSRCAGPFRNIGTKRAL